MIFFTKVIDYLKTFNMKFSDPPMEKEYMSIQNRNQITDFQISIIVLVLISIVTLGWSIANGDTVDIALTAAIIGVLVVIFLLKRHFQNKTNYAILFIIFLYNVYRLAFLVHALAELTKTIMFNAGYTYAVLQMILFSRIHNFYYRVGGIFLCYLLRFGVLIGFVEKSSVGVPTLIRHIIIDVFIIYYFYSQEKTSRNFFREFFLEREELMRFKELLDKDLPQCLAVRDYITKDGIFINNSFLNTFATCEPIHSNVDDVSAETTEPEKPFCGALHIDPTTLKEMGVPYRKHLDTFRMARTLKDIIMGLTMQNIIEDKAFTVSASWPYKVGGKKTFHVILKKVIWNRTDAIVVIMNETTAQEKVNSLKVANENKDKIIATVSHELRTPLNGIIGLLDMAKEKTVHPDAINYISLSKDNARLLLSLVNSNLDLQQITAGKLRLNPTKINISKTVNDIIQLLQFQTKQKGIYLEANINGDLPETVITDENRLKQILINLVGNAVKFTCTGGIKIEVCQDDTDEKCLKVSVVDTGIGIKDEDKGKLFQMYGRLEEGRNVNKNGVGLGLIISNMLAILLSGRTDEKGIELESSSGVGSRFYFKIKKALEGFNETNNDPICSKMIKERDEANILTEFSEDLFTSVNLNNKLSSYAHLKRTTMLDIHMVTKTMGSRPDETLSLTKQVTLAKTLAETSSRGRKGHIIVVDDNPFNLLVISNLLKDVNVPSKTVLGGYEAVELVKLMCKEGEPIQAILMDCHMPIIDGYQTTTMLRDMMEKKEISDVPIFALSAGGSEEEIQKCFVSGMKGYLMKPLTKKALMDELDKLEQSQNA